MFWITDRVQELKDRYPSATFGYFGAGPVRSWEPAFDVVDLEVEALNQPDTIAACAHIHKLCESMAFTHGPDPILVESLKGAERRELDGGGWAWDWRNSRSNIAPIAAVTGALWLLESHDQVELWGFSG